jgi:uncharacterized protein YndB with AHSA1/START domain
MPDLHHLVEIEASPAKVFDALVTQSGLRSWWTADSTAEARVGSVAEFGFMERALVFRMEIAELSPGKRAVWKCVGDHAEWEGTRITWEMGEENGVTTLRMTHAGWREVSPFCASCNSTWGELMYRLKDAVEGRNPGPRWKK